jgi:hypothetical protein
MIEGPENDDKYRMVEDEFTSIAGQFTAHLHAAEYQRLKQQAKDQNADKISSISRPVLGPLTTAARRRQEERKRVAKQRDGLRRVAGLVKGAGSGGDGVDADIPWAGSSLHGLMESPHRKGMRLSAVAASTAGTRAAAGFRRAMGSSQLTPQPTARRQHLREIEIEEEDDLDAPIENLSTNPVSTSSRPISGAHIPVRRMQALASDSTISPGFTAMVGSGTNVTRGASSMIINLPQDDTECDNGVDDFDLFNRRRNRSRSSRAQKEGTASKKPEGFSDSKQDVIPTFL